MAFKITLTYKKLIKDPSQIVGLYTVFKGCPRLVKSADVYHWEKYVRVTFDDDTVMLFTWFAVRDFSDTIRLLIPSEICRPPVPKEKPTAWVRAKKVLSAAFETFLEKLD